MRRLGDRQKFAGFLVERKKPPVGDAEIGAVQEDFAARLAFAHIRKAAEICERVDD